MLQCRLHISKQGVMKIQLKDKLKCIKETEVDLQH